MTELTLWQGKLPVLHLPQKQLVQQLNQLEYIAVVAKAAMDEMSNTFSYSEWKLATTLKVVAQLNQAMATGSLRPEEEATFHRLTKEYLDTMQKFGQIAATRFLEEVQKIPDEVGGGSLLDQLRSLLGY